MDNAGGHGTKEAIEQYSKDLLEKYCIEIIFQVPRSPYTHGLDLGFWMALHARVKRQHFLKHSTTHALVNSVNEVWTASELDQCLI